MKRNRLYFLTGLFFLLGFLMAGSVLAEDRRVFYEDFESEDLSNWTLSGSGKDWEIKKDGSPFDKYHAKAKDTDGPSIMQTSINKSNYADLNIKFY